MLWCLIHVCFVQGTTCGAPDTLTRLGTCTFLLLSHFRGSHNKFQKKSAHTEARQRVESAKQCSTLSLGHNKHGKNITTALFGYGLVLHGVGLQCTRSASRWAEYPQIVQNPNTFYHMLPYLPYMDVKCYMLIDIKCYMLVRYMVSPDLGISLFQIAQSLSSLKRTLICKAKVRFNQMSEERRANWQNPILIGPLMRGSRKKELIKTRSNFEYRSVKMVEKKHKNAKMFT